MKKTIYQAPHMEVVAFSVKHTFLAASPTITGVSAGDTGISFGGGGTVPAVAPELDFDAADLFDE